MGAKRRQGGVPAKDCFMKIFHNILVFVKGLLPLSLHLHNLTSLWISFCCPIVLRLLALDFSEKWAPLGVSEAGHARIV